MDVKVPTLAESVTEGEIGSWLKKDGESVRKGEAILELQTDKASLEIAADASGVLRTLKAAGDVVRVGDVVARIDDGAAASPGAPPAPPRAQPAPAAAPPAVKLRDEPAPEPRTTQVEGPARLPAPARADASPPAAPPADTTSPTTPAPRAAGASDEPGTRRERMSRLRRRIAERLVEAQHQAAILTTFNEADMSAAMALRTRHQEWFTKRYGLKLGYMSIFAQAVVHALRAVPSLNAFIEGEDVVHHEHVHLGVAVQTDKGLVVPVVRHAERMGLGALEKEIARLAALARSGKIGLDDLYGATFTISNGGVFGSLMSTPILNPPQSGILGMHAIKQRPVVLPDGTIVARPMMYLALSYDHRIVDGREAVTFLVEVKDRVEDPERLMLE